MFLTAPEDAVWGERAEAQRGSCGLMDSHGEGGGTALWWNEGGLHHLYHAIANNK